VSSEARQFLLGGTASQPWEARLLDLARQAEGQGDWLEAYTGDRASLERSYRLCAQLTREHSRTFSLAAALLPAQERRAIHALYAFCRLTDDSVDRAPSGDGARLAAWAEEALSSAPGAHTPELLAWQDTVARYHIPRRYAEQLVAAVAQDLVVRRYESFAQLAEYCYGVASTVGLMAMTIVGYSSARATEPAIKLGVALQLTNILRDVGEDWRAGRLYLPLAELALFGVTEADIERGVAGGPITPQWRACMRFQIARARRLYAEGLPGVRWLRQEARFAVRAAGELYQAILAEIERNDYDVFTRRAHVSSLGKLRRVPGIWLRAALPIARD